jgi:hypothetical protein
MFFQCASRIRFFQSLLLAALPVLWPVATARAVVMGPFASEFQSSSRPHGLDIVAPVMTNQSDGLSASFSDDWLPDFDYHGKRMAATIANPPEGYVRLANSPITLPVAHDVRTYFVGEGAGFRNSLGFNTTGLGIESGTNPLLIFPNASTPNDWIGSNHSHGENNPLLPGDFVELGSHDANTTFDFFLVQRGGQTPQGYDGQVFSSDASQNLDGAVHMVAFAVADSPYLLVGFEDRSDPTDWDYNDTVFAVYVGEENVNLLASQGGGSGVPVPEPGFLWLTVAACGGWLWRAQRQRRKDRVS